MADVEAQPREQSPVQPKPISRFSTCTSTRMSEANKHIVPMPRWMSITGVARFVIAILVLMFTAAATAIFGGYTAFGFTLFTSCATLIIFGYYYVALSRKPVLYNRWAVLGLELFGLIFWAVSFSLCAEWTASANSDYWFNGGDTRFGFWNAPFDPKDIGLIGRSLTKRSSSKWRGGVACGGVAAGLGAVEFFLFTTTLFIFTINLQKHRLAGNPATYGGASTAPATTAAEPAPVPVEKSEGKKAEVASTTEGEQAQVLRKDSNSVV